MGESLLLIDAYSQIFRAYYAIRQLNNAKGEPVNALFVFTRLLLKLEKSFPGTRGAMLFDCGKVDFRLKLAADYKANRPPMPDSLKAQMPGIRELASAFGWPMLQCENYEADDLIGALAKHCPDREIRIVSSDKDLSQLVDDRVAMLVPQNGSKGDFEVRGRAEVEAKFGVPPELVVDYLALLGDNSDNISGVPGIGPKSAAELLQSFGAVAQWVDDPPEALRQSKFFKKLSGNLELLKRNLQLVALRTELPANWQDHESLLQRKAPDWKLIREICERNQFNSIIKELPKPEKESPAPPPETADEADDLFVFAERHQQKELKNEKKCAQLELF